MTQARQNFGPIDFPKDRLLPGWTGLVTYCIAILSQPLQIYRYLMLYARSAMKMETQMLRKCSRTIRTMIVAMCNGKLNRNHDYHSSVAQLGIHFYCHVHVCLPVDCTDVWWRWTTTAPGLTLAAVTSTTPTSATFFSSLPVVVFMPCASCFHPSTELFIL